MAVAAKLEADAQRCDSLGIAQSGLVPDDQEQDRPSARVIDRYRMNSYTKFQAGPGGSTGAGWVPGKHQGHAHSASLARWIDQAANMRSSAASQRRTPPVIPA